MVDVLKKLEECLSVTDSLTEKITQGFNYKVTDRKVCELVTQGRIFASVFVDSKDCWTYVDWETGTKFKVDGMQGMAESLGLLLPELNAEIVDLIERENFAKPN